MKYLCKVGSRSASQKLMYEDSRNLYFTRAGLTQNEIAFIFSDDKNVFSFQILKNLRIAKIAIAENNIAATKYFSVTSITDDSKQIPQGLAALLSILVKFFKIQELSELSLRFETQSKLYFINQGELKINLDEIFYIIDNNYEVDTNTDDSPALINPLITMYEGYMPPEIHYCSEYTFINNFQIAELDKVPNFDIINNINRSLLIFSVNQSETVFYQTENDGVLKSVNIDCFYKLIEEGKIKQSLFDSSILVNKLVEIRQSIASSVRYAINSSIKSYSDYSLKTLGRKNLGINSNSDVLHSEVEKHVSSEFGEFWAYENGSLKYISTKGEILRVSANFKLPIEFMDCRGKKHMIQSQVLLNEILHEIKEPLDLAYGFYKSVFQKDKLKQEQRCLNDLNKMVSNQIEMNKHITMISKYINKSSGKASKELHEESNLSSEIQELLRMNQEFKEGLGKKSS